MKTDDEWASEFAQELIENTITQNLPLFVVKKNVIDCLKKYKQFTPKHVVQFNIRLESVEKELKFWMDDKDEMGHEFLKRALERECGFKLYLCWTGI